MNNWLDDTQPEGSDSTSASGSFWEKAPSARRSAPTEAFARADVFTPADATAPLPVGTPDRHSAFDYVDPDEPLHDPHELTVQLAAVDPASLANGGSGSQLDPQDVTGTPVFVDESGRRSRRLRLLGSAVGVACGVYAVVIVATLVSGNSSAPWLPLPGQNDDIPAGQVEISPQPSVEASPTGSESAAPGTDPTGSAPTASATGAATVAPAASTSPGGLDTSALPQTSTGATPRNPAGSATASAPAASASPAASPEASQPVTGGGDASPTADDSGGTGDGGEANALSAATP
ncbi:hypothetical protein ACGFZG_06920 [Streptomyces antibioticus]|uniref:hypothetical protein n=1 Tax=Streptomyces antibioticus TaxID=1890 RepID=UPI003722EDA4